MSPVLHWARHGPKILVIHLCIHGCSADLARVRVVSHGPHLVPLQLCMVRGTIA
jgi:hypothetical protein